MGATLGPTRVAPRLRTELLYFRCPAVAGYAARVPSDGGHRRSYSWAFLLLGIDDEIVKVTDSDRVTPSEDRITAREVSAGHFGRNWYAPASGALPAGRATPARSTFTSGWSAAGPLPVSGSAAASR